MAQAQVYKPTSNLRRWTNGLALMGLLMGCGAGVWVAGQRIAAEQNRILPDTEAVMLTNRGPAEAIAFSPQGDLMAVGGASHIGGRSTITLWDPKAGVRQIEWEGHGEVTEALAFSPDGRLLATGGRDDQVHIRDAATGQPIQALPGQHGLVRSLSFSPDGRLLAVASGYGQNAAVQLWELPTGESKLLLEGDNGHLQFTHDGKSLVVGDKDGSVRVIGVNTGEILRSLPALSEPISSIAVAPNDQSVAVGGIEGGVQLWNLQTGQKEATLSGHDSTVHGVAFSPDGRFLVSVANDSLIHIWDTKSGEIRQTLSNRYDPPSSVAFSPDGESLAVGYFNLGKVKIWNWMEGKKR